jgi:uncharacterized protein YqjF (DUF2071 family)
LDIDTFDGQAWIGITPFALTQLRLLSLPPIPGLDSFLELNVRTYVLHQGVPGVWFFSLDASKAIPAMAARILFSLPYFKAEMEFSDCGGQFQFASRRTVSPAADFKAAWRSGLRLRAPDLESLAFFLVERYCLFAAGAQGLSMTRIYHHPWILDEAVVTSYGSSMVTSLGIREPSAAPLAQLLTFTERKNLGADSPMIYCAQSSCCAIA